MSLPDMTKVAIILRKICRQVDKSPVTSSGSPGCRPQACVKHQHKDGVDEAKPAADLGKHAPHGRPDLEQAQP